VTPEGGLAGYAAVVPWKGALRYDVLVDPSWSGARGSQAGSCWPRCQARGAELARGGACRPLARLYVAGTSMPPAGRSRGNRVSPGAIPLSDAHPHGGAAPAARVAGRITVRTAVPGQDDRAIHALSPGPRSTGLAAHRSRSSAGKSS